MPLSRTWYSAVNRSLDDVTTGLRSHASMWFSLIRLLTGAEAGTNGASGAPPSSSYWTVHSSHACGVAASSGNNFSTTFTASQWLRNTAGNSHAWFVLQSPNDVLDGPWYIMVSLGTSSDQQAIIAVAKSAFSGGTTTADPTATNQSTYTAFQVHPNTTTAGRAHVVVDDDGNFFFYSSKNSSGYAHFTLMGQSLQNAASSGDSARFVILAQYLDSGRGVPSMEANNISVRGLSFNGTTALTSGTGRIPAISAAGTSMATALTGVNSATGKADGLPVAFVIDSTVGGQGIRGRIPDIELISAMVAVAAGEPAAAAPERCVLGTWAVPMEVVPLL